MTTQPKYDFRSLAITNIGCDDARKIMDFFLHMTESKINANLSLQKNMLLLADLIRMGSYVYLKCPYFQIVIIV